MKKKIFAAAMAAALLLCGCGSDSSGSSEVYDETSASSEESVYEGGAEEDYVGYEETTTTAAASEISYDCALDLIGEALGDIKYAGLNYHTITSLAEYDPDTMGDYTILVDETCAFAAGVLCKGDAVIVDGIETSKTMDDYGLDINSDLCFSAATNSYYNPRIITLNESGEQYHAYYYWRVPDTNDLFTVDSYVPSDFVFVYKDSNVYLPEHDFMGFDWGDDRSYIKSSLIDRGNKLTFYDSGNITLASASEKLYGYDFWANFIFNGNSQFTEGQYHINPGPYGASSEEYESIYRSALYDLISKYGDSYKLEMYEGYRSIEDIMSRHDEIKEGSRYSKTLFEIYWNVNDHTRIRLAVPSSAAPSIYYTSIEKTGGTGQTEDSLI